MSVALICEARRMSDRRCSSIPISAERSVFLSFSIASLIKERFCGGGFRRHAHGLVHCRFIILQQPFVQFLLGEIDHFTARFVVRYLLARCELVQHTFRNPDIHTGFLKREHSLGREDGISSNVIRSKRLSTGSNFFSTDSMAASRPLIRSMNVILFGIITWFDF